MQPKILMIIHKPNRVLMIIKILIIHSNKIMNKATSKEMSKVMSKVMRRIWIDKRRIIALK